MERTIGRLLDSPPEASWRVVLCIADQSSLHQGRVGRGGLGRLDCKGPMKQSVKDAGQRKCEPTHYLNVDLDIFSSVSLKGLVNALGDEALVLYVGGKGQKHEARVELASSHNLTADRTIMGLIRLVDRLPPRYRRVWDSADSREFNVGIEAGLEPHDFGLRLNRRTVQAVASVSGVIVVTVYAPVLKCES